MRESILRALKQEGHVSGEVLGKRLNISRTAVWKHVKELRQKGYRIDSSTRTGYSFIKGPDLLLSEEISPGLDTHIIGKQILYREEVTSTQDIAEELARGGAEEGLVVVSERQTKGRGRKGRNWISPAREGVYLSIVLRPGLKASQIIQIPLVASVAVSRAIKAVTPLYPRIKWPNDIMIGEKKVGGILTEMSCEIDRINYAILGIGINVNTPKSLLPGPIRVRATSLSEECGDYVSRISLVQCFLAELETLYSQFLTSGFETIRGEWKVLSNTLGSWVEVCDVKERLEGKALDVDEDGFLLVRKEDGDVKRIITGDVYLRNRDA